MNHEPTNDYTNISDVPGEIRPAWDAVERLAARERGSAGAGLEQRLFDATRALLGERPAVIARIGFTRSWAFRIAASVAVVGAGVLAVMMLNKAMTPSVAPNQVADGGATPVVAPVESASGVTVASLREQLDAELSEWTSQTRSGWGDTEVAALTSHISSIEQSPADPWSQVESSTQEPSL